MIYVKTEEAMIAVATVLAVAFWFFAGYSVASKSWRSEAVENGAAEYTQTGEWRWKNEDKQKD